ncbi:type VII secretion system ESX-1 target, MMAR_2894 family [Mycobacterium marinum]|uniref:PE family protein n=1 Tax=Mycobacterium marinum (strain ATCC BAA-535 / M) TaxID=216594 RepID=B2HE54_MYCMM|nr:type VII secretion system ESX-1 target, MMAR_2894 family [Mycobacterium marinum]ACC41334.1 PE family protein [Mycobacterium marinum M]AXN44847.1 putative PE family protein PE35 [Mycobacterium marinum]AXN50225.1 putative PE family protein PE35 [Mycobacterium marinum]EPQ76675.1 putative pe family protein [Mycobacterium marinum MB2]EPQ80563.1 putative family protein [Mycobacterium marinum str. Europe]
MDPMSHDPAAGDIGSQLVDIGTQGISAGTTAAMTVLTGLIPAGAEEVSAQAVLAFAQEAATMLASNVAAQEELMRTGTALSDIARMYGDADDVAADALTFRGAAMSNPAAAGSSGFATGAGLRAGAFATEAGPAAQPLVSQLIGSQSSPMAAAAANAGSSAMSGAAPMGSGMGAGSSAGGASKPGLVSATGPADEEEERKDSAAAGEQNGLADVGQREDASGSHPVERLM